ncbi:hypothetical protein ACH5RR_021575 [Cinchona calisaya]|uniref:Non-structural maintenance of chromosomes element 1 homolog n=1 Tax=Cinchona calisaya TaxID=153742 RepID=A0ABD2ZHQ6_9GENT
MLLSCNRRFQLEWGSQSQYTSTEISSALKNFSMAQKDRTLEEFVRDQWLCSASDGWIGLGVRSFLDLRSWFHNNEVATCQVCNEAAVKIRIVLNISSTLHYEVCFIKADALWLFVYLRSLSRPALGNLLFRYNAPLQSWPTLAGFVQYRRILTFVCQIYYSALYLLTLRLPEPVVSAIALLAFTISRLSFKVHPSLLLLSILCSCTLGECCLNEDCKIRMHHCCLKKLFSQGEVVAHGGVWWLKEKAIEEQVDDQGGSSQRLVPPDPSVRKRLRTTKAVGCNTHESNSCATSASLSSTRRFTRSFTRQSAAV